MSACPLATSTESCALFAPCKRDHGQKTATHAQAQSAGIDARHVGELVKFELDLFANAAV